MEDIKESDQPRQTRGWLISVGVIGLFVCSTCILGLLAIVTVSIRSSGIYEQALEQVKNDDAIIALLGEPIEEGWLIQGSIATSNDGTGGADFQVPISGPLNSGAVFVTGHRNNNIWTIDELIVRIDDEVVYLVE